jgi:predicted amidophosphoribosyltransferase
MRNNATFNGMITYQIENDKFVYCLFCGKTLPTEGKYCPFCGKELPRTCTVGPVVVHWNYDSGEPSYIGDYKITVEK